MIVRDSVLTHWLRTAQAGDELVYARVTSLPIASAVAARVRDLAADGQVILFRQRRAHGPGSENFNYVARRTAKAIDVATKDGAKDKTGARGRVVKARAPQDKRVGAQAALAREIVPQVRRLIAERAVMSVEGRPSVGAIRRALGLQSDWPVRVALAGIERMAA